MAGYMVKANEGESATMTNLLLMEFIRNMPEYTDLSKREEQVSVKLTDDDGNRLTLPEVIEKLKDLRKHGMDVYFSATATRPSSYRLSDRVPMTEMNPLEAWVYILKPTKTKT
ncbi:MAG TPA: hypothetical protein VJH34_03170 [archaeon]|nr:hypothetical protein [archaeon]